MFIPTASDSLICSAEINVAYFSFRIKVLFYVINQSLKSEAVNR